MKDKEPKKERYSHKRAAEKLAACVIATLGSRGRIGMGSGIVCMRDRKTGKMEFKHWATDFFDALDYCGIVYDREAFFAKDKKRSKSK